MPGGRKDEGSIRGKVPEVGDDSQGRALRRKTAIDGAVASSSGDAGEAQGDGAKKAIKKGLGV